MNTVTARPTRTSVDGVPVLWFHNGRWVSMPHRFCFVNNLREHLRHIQGFEKKRIENIRILASLQAGDTVIVNHCTFRHRKDSDK